MSLPVLCLLQARRFSPFVFLSPFGGDEGYNNLCHTKSTERQANIYKYSCSHSRAQQCRRMGLLSNIHFMPGCDTQLLHAEIPKLSFRTASTQQSKLEHPKPCGGALPAAPWAGNKGSWSQMKRQSSFLGAETRITRDGSEPRRGD